MNYYPNTEWGRHLAALDSQDKKRLKNMRPPPVKAKAPATEMVSLPTVTTAPTRHSEKTLGQRLDSFCNVGSAVSLVLIALVLIGASL